MSEATKVIVDNQAIGRKGMPRYPEAHGRVLPTKFVPVDAGEPVTSHPGLTLAEYAAAKRWEKEVGGITIGNYQIASDDRSKLLISGARQGADNDADFTTFFAFADGHSEVINAEQIIAISDVLLAHVADVFRVYGDVMQRIITGEITTPEQVDAAFAS